MIQQRGGVLMSFERHYDERLDDITFASAPDSDEPKEPQTPPQIVLDTLSLVLSAIEDSRNLIISTPCRDSFGQVLATLLSFEYQLQAAGSTPSRPSTSSSFKPGDKLKMGNAVVEFVRTNTDTGGIVVRYEPKRPLTHTLTYEQSILLQKTDSKRRLASSSLFNKERKKLNALIRTRGNVINDLSNKMTYANTTVIYVGALNRFSNYCAETLVDGTGLSNLALSAHIELAMESNACQLKPLGRGQYSGVPSLAISSNPYALLDITNLDDDARSHVGAVIIDTDNLDAFIERNMEYFRILQDMAIPIFVIVSNANSAAAATIRSEGFFEWRWDYRTLDQCGNECQHHDKQQQRYFDNLETRCNYCAQFKLQIATCKNGQIAELQRLMTEVDGLLGDDCGDTEIEEVRQELWMTLLRLLRAIVPYDAVSHLPRQDEGAHWIATINRRRGYIPTEARDSLLRVVDGINELLKGGYNPKRDLLENRINLLDHDDRLVIAMRTEAEVDDASTYWKNILDQDTWNNLRFIPFSCLKAQKNTFDGRMIVSGWFGRDRMTDVVFGYNAAITELMLYEGSETEWYVNQSNVWKRALKDRDDTKDILSLSGVEFSKTLSPLSEPLKRLPHTKTPLETTEDRWKLRTYHQHEAKDFERGQSISAIPIRYAGDRVAFYLDRSLLTDITTIIASNTLDETDNNEAQARQVRVGDAGSADSLHEGSFVVLRETDKDVLEQLADNYYLRDEADKKRRLAREWQTALDELTEEYSNNSRDVYDALCEHGMNKGYQAFTALSERIAPGRSSAEITETVVAIARALHNPTLEARAEFIAAAALDVQNAHRSAGKQLGKMLGAALLNYISVNDIAKSEDIWEPISLDLDTLGEVSIYRIIEVDRDHRVNVIPAKIGKVYEE